MSAPEVQARLEELREVLRSESMSWGELAELQALAEHIEASDVELLEAAGVPEHAETETEEKLRAVVERAWIDVVPDHDPDPSYLEQVGWEARLAAYLAGEFGYVGVQACAELRYQTEQDGWIVGPVVRSPGLWGIESDSGETYFREVGEEEISQLAEMLEALGVRAPLVSAFELRYS